MIRLVVAAASRPGLSAESVDSSAWCAQIAAVPEPARRTGSAFDQRRLTSQPRDLTVCQFRLRGRQFSGNVVALLTSRTAFLPRAAQGAFSE